MTVLKKKKKNERGNGALVVWGGTIIVRDRPVKRNPFGTERV